MQNRQTNRQVWDRWIQHTDRWKRGWQTDSGRDTEKDRWKRNARIDGKEDGRRQTDIWTEKRMDNRRTRRQMGKRIPNRQMDREKDGWMDGWMQDGTRWKDGQKKKRDDYRTETPMDRRMNSMCDRDIRDEKLGRLTERQTDVLLDKRIDRWMDGRTEK